MTTWTDDGLRRISDAEELHGPRIVGSVTGSIAKGVTRRAGPHPLTIARTSSVAGDMPAPLPPHVEQALANTPTEELLRLPVLSPDAMGHTGDAYGLSKRANHLRVHAAAMTWGDHGARVNSISPGIILSPLAQEELDSPAGPVYTAPEIARVGTGVAARARFGVRFRVATRRVVSHPVSRLPRTQPEHGAELRQRARDGGGGGGSRTCQRHVTDISRGVRGLLLPRISNPRFAR